MVSQWGGERAEIKIEMLIALLLIHRTALYSSSQGESTAEVQRHEKERSGMLCATEPPEGTRSRQHLPDYTDP